MRNTTIVMIFIAFIVVTIQLPAGVNKLNMRTVGAVKVDDKELALRIATAPKPGISFSASQSKIISQTVNYLKQKNTAAAVNEWKSLIGSLPKNVDINSVIQWVLRQSYLESMEDLRYHAEKVKFYNEQKNAIRNYINELRSKTDQLRLGQKIQVNKPVLLDYKYERITNVVKIPQKPVKSEPCEYDTDSSAIETKKELEAIIEELEEDLAQAGDDAQLANVDLQNVLQRQQQTLQMLSQIAKTLHDTAMAVIRKMGG